MDNLIDRQFHICACRSKKPTSEEKTKLYKFIRNFKIMFINGDEFML